MLNDISLQIRAGEIVGLAGLVGSGRTELARAIAGADPIDGGTIASTARSAASARPRDAIAAGIAFLTESRKKDGLFMELSLAANTTFADVPRGLRAIGILRRGVERVQDAHAAGVALGRPAVPR